MYEIQQLDKYDNWEVIPEGEFDTIEEAQAALYELVNNLGWENLRINLA